jgi:hypothetical protein
VKILRSVLAGFAIISSACAAASVRAAPFVDVRAHWNVYKSDESITPLPDGFTVSCAGDAQTTADGCSGEAELQAVADAPGTYAVTSTGVVIITNTTSQEFNGYYGFNTWFSSFNPGGPAIGLGIDDPLTQWARFSSSVFGEGVGDSHRCAVGYLGEEGTVFSPTTCGVSSPDSSSGILFLDLATVAPGSSVFFSYTISIIAEFVSNDPEQGVPAPGGIALMVLGLAVLAFRKQVLPSLFSIL